MAIKRQDSRNKYKIGFKSHILILIASIFIPASTFDIQLQQRQIIPLDAANYTLVSTQFQASTYRYVMVQTVAQLTNLTVSYNSEFGFSSRINGTSRGLVYLLKGGENNINTYLASTNGRLRSQVVAIPYLRTDPIPGGCCITCNFDNNPNIYITKELLTIKLKFERANVYYDPGTKPKPCDGGSFSTFKNLEYDLYAFQLTENDFTEGDLFNGMWKMAHPRNIKRYGKMVAKIKGTKGPIFVMQMIPRQGIVYNILVRDSVAKTEAAYVPTFAYDCDLSNIATCKSFGSITSIIYAVITGIIGLALCFLGHKFLKSELFIGGVISGFIITYTLLLRFATLTYIAHMLSSTAGGFVFGLLMVVLYLETKQFHTLFLNNAILIGAMLACCMLFSPVGDLKAFSSNTVYLLTFFAITFVCPIPLSFFPKVTSILFSSLIGGYMAVLSCSLFIHANIQYLVIEFILRAGIPSFANAYLRVPFQRNEFILCGAWGFLLIAGAFSQYFFTRNEVFPPKSKRGRRRSRTRFSWFRRRQGVTNRMFDERTPLLPNDNVEYRYGSERSTDLSTQNQKREPVNVKVV